MSRKHWLAVLVFLWMSVGVVPAYAQGTPVFTDIENSPHKEAILDLHRDGVIHGFEDSRFYPQKHLTRAEAASLLVKGFHLTPIEPIALSDPQMVKSFSYSDPLGVIDESFSIPSAQDLIGHWGMNDIEGLIKVRAVGVEANTFSPDSFVTRVEWREMLAKLILGANSAAGAEELVELGLLTKEESGSAELITREEAAGSLHRILQHPDFKIVTVFATSDIHSHLEPYQPAGTEYVIGGLAKMSHILKETRKKQPNTLLVDAGDAPYNTNIGNLFEGASTIEVMNEMNYDAMVLGNHDFDFPFDVMERNAESAQFPFLSANTLYNQQKPSFLHSSVIKEVDGVRIGIVGVTDDESHYYTHPKNVEGISFIDHFEAAQREVDELREQTDVIIALAHLHGDNPVLPTKVKGIDVEIGGGQDVVDFPKLIDGTWLISPGKHAEVLNQINIQMFAGQMIGLNFAHLFMTDNLQSDPGVTGIIERYSSQLDEKMKQVIGKTEVHLDGERQTVRMKESNLGNAVADSLRELTGADIALQNGGGIRTSIPEGEITLEQIYAVLPFDNTVVMVEASGQTVWDALEHSLASYPAAAGGFLQVSGIEYTFDAAKEAGSRLVEVTIDGQPLDRARMYKVVANDFLTGGGDKFTMLKEETVLMQQTKHYLRDAFTEYVQKHGTIAPQPEGRIQILNAEE
ncbi:5'-nucleotidase C-terminal domain-containing protein [Paenibacillus sp. J2TS4]|uniref:5'-nucleotidase C-terminal domain-containing protein n=1 Tax=Paenibacillus sp. J2TS4 TaxID=2807194 RepID=UPI001B122F61|nr:5'-nucleotidase C-terminal domain-containing protein [Paenibacillus sp. J2TS4]GIP35221.1 hypothetical protein J2TS4_44310 [Paenibacillus sp. J2TS4]